MMILPLVLAEADLKYILLQFWSRTYLDYQRKNGDRHIYIYLK